MRTIEGRVNQICVDLEEALEVAGLFTERCRRVLRQALLDLQQDCVMSALDALDGRTLHEAVASAIREIR